MIRTIVYIISLWVSSTPILVIAANQTYQVEEAINLQADSKIMAQYSRPMVLEMAASDCPYCRMLEENVLVPMLISGAYEERVLIRSLDIFNHTDVINFNGEKITQAELAERYSVVLTPTLLFLDHKGEIIVNQMLGVPNLDFYGLYLDANIDQAIKVMKAR